MHNFLLRGELRMYVIVVGLNHKTAPVEIREKITFSNETLHLALDKVKKTKSVLEAVILSTCNRSEIYAVVDQLHTGEHFTKKFLTEWFSIEKENLLPYLYFKQDIEATEHLFRVVTGLDSMILGETQILGQVRQSFFAAQESGATGTIFNNLFKQAVTFAKKVHSETGIGENAVSVSYAAVELTKKIFDKLTNKTVLIVGAGETSELTAIHLQAHGIKQINVINRNFETAKKLAETFQGKAYPMEQLSEALFNADIVISSTGSNTSVIKRKDIEAVINKRVNKPLFLIDLAVPRDIESSANKLANIYLYDIDDLRDIVDANLKERERVAEKINVWINEEVYNFYQWVNTLGVIPLIAALREKSLLIQEETMKSIENKLPDLSEKEIAVIRKHTKSIVNQMLKNPIIRVKELAAEPDAEYMIQFFKKIFDIEDQDINPNLVYNLMSRKKKVTEPRKYILSKLPGLKAGHKND